MPFLFLILVGISFAAVPFETEGMEASGRSDGTFLMASPSYFYDRALGEGGVHAQSALWTPMSYTQRLILDRYSMLPSWEVQDPAVWIQTGNEIGDMIYQDLITPQKERPTNRVPMLEAGFRSPSYRSFWATARLFQVDHFSSNTLRLNTKVAGSMNYAHFGSNLPAFSTAYAGFGYSGVKNEAYLLVGKEYLWLFGESGRWVSTLASPKVQARYRHPKMDIFWSYDFLEFQNKKLKEEGLRKEWKGSIYFPYASECEKKDFEIGGGIDFRAVKDSGDVYFGLKDNRVFWAFMQMDYLILDNLSFKVHAGMNERDWLVKDSLEFVATPFAFSTLLWGYQNLWATRLNPMADSYEYFDSDTLKLFTDSYLQLHKIYARWKHSKDSWSLEFSPFAWAEYGAESFDTTAFKKVNKNTWYRLGNRSRVDSWIYSAGAKISLAYWFGNWFDVQAKTGFERIWGPKEFLEVEPIEKFLSIEANWTLKKTLQVSHSWHYRSQSKWNLRHPETFEVPSTWFWNFSLSQLFPKQGLRLTGTVLHLLSDNILEVPNGNINHTRFFATIKKDF
ncbi:MAG: hypothetical protein GX116_01515 [Fibrobacter sp.]|jgi:hypothetical protein|nr:hypothetical protein [Fibrobacter sp.]